MKTVSAAAVTLIFIVVAALAFGCTKESLTGSAIKVAVIDSGSNDSSTSGSSSGIGTGEESQEGCAIDGGLLDRIFSGKGPL